MLATMTSRGPGALRARASSAPVTPRPLLLSSPSARVAVASSRRPAPSSCAARALPIAAAAHLPITRRPLRLRVDAYREHRDIGREKTIVRLGDRVVGAMMRMLCRPPSSAKPSPDDILSLRGDTAAHLEVRVDGVLDREALVGQDALLAWIERERDGGSGSGASGGTPPCSAWRLVASASCPLDDAYFALVETVHPRTTLSGKEREPLVLHKIVWLDVELDDTKRIVSGVHVRGQIEPDDLSGLVSVDSAHRALSATPFPHDRVKPYPPGLNVDVPLSNQKRWCDARCSKNDERALLFGGDTGGDSSGGGKDEALSSPAIDRARYRLWDAFGVLPVLCSPQRRMDPDACVVPGEAVAEIIKGAKDRFEIDCRLQDAAVSFEKTVAFTRWLSMCKDKKTGAEFKLEGLEAVVFDEEGKLLDTWLFRDATPGERARLVGE